MFLLNKFLFFIQNIIQCLLDAYKIKEIMSFKKDDYEISLDFDFYILLVDCGQGRPKGQETQARALGLKILSEKKTSKKLIWLEVYYR